MEKKRKGTMLRLEEQDIQSILDIRKYYRITSDNQAIVFAINLVARQISENDGKTKQIIIDGKQCIVENESMSDFWDTFGG